MKTKNLIIGLKIFFLANFLTSCNDDYIVNVKNYDEKVVVANRGSASISFIDPSSDKVTNTLSIPNSEPMYVVYVPATDKLYVGDRAQNKVHVVDPQNQVVERSIDVGKGVFHMWADGLGKQLWVVNDTDKSISVIELKSNTVLQTIPVDLQPHDVFLTKDATKAYVSVTNSDKFTPDKVYMYSIPTLTKTNETSVGKDPHLFYLSNSNKLFVPCQSGQVFSLNGTDLSLNSSNPYVGAHGIYASPDQNTVFVTNITESLLYSIKASDNTQNGKALASLKPTPHNIVLNNDGTKMFVSHSGASANSVSTYNVNNATLTAGTVITAGTNPFGITYFKRLIN